MRKFLFFVAVVWSMVVSAAELGSLTWAQVCRGGMPAEWYGSAEACDIADLLLSVQRNNGGWNKNIEFHLISEAERNELMLTVGGESCLDNHATTQEMRFLAKVWSKTGVERYREAYLKALDMLFAAQKDCGGWSQYWPLRKKGYFDYITFNDDLMTNVMKILRSTGRGEGEFRNIADEERRARCLDCFDRAVELILECQIDDNGTKAIWCAQHDPEDMLPVMGRAFEPPSASGYESVALLSYLMTLDNPSAELREAITAAVEWLDAHKIENKALEDYTNSKGEPDKRIIDKPGQHLWGRFIQLGGESGRVVYEKHLNILHTKGRTRPFLYDGMSLTCTDEENARATYRADKAYQPIYSFADDELPITYYRFLYNYEDSEPLTDVRGVPAPTSLNASSRVNYSFLGNWAQRLIELEYPLWEKALDVAEAGGIMLSAKTFTYTEGGGLTYLFDGGFSVSNNDGRYYGTGSNNTIKYSAGVDYTISLPEGMKVDKMELYGYCNYETDAFISRINGKSFTSSEYVFPGRVGGNAVNVSHTFDFGDVPAEGKITFRLGGKQCCLLIILYGTNLSGITDVKTDATKCSPAVKLVRDGQVVISSGSRIYNLAGQEVE